MSTTLSADGTAIGYDRIGDGPPVVLVMGAFNDRSAGAPLAAQLAADFTVFNYDRRGRGSSADTPPYAVEREIEDLAALLTEAGGQACVFGYSSGAVLALRSADHGLPITKLALYDPPFLIEGTTAAHWNDMAHEIESLVAQGRRGDAVELYQTKGVGIPPDVVAQLRKAPFWPALEATAHTLGYDAQVLACPPDLPLRVTTTTLVIHGADGPPVLAAATRAVADALPDGELISLAGQTHDLVPDVVGPVLRSFYGV